MIESGRVPGKSRISASTKKLSERVPKNGRFRVRTGKWKDSGKNRDKVESVLVPKNCSNEYRKWKNTGQYRKMIESGRVPGKGRIRAIIVKLFEPVPKNGRIRVSTRK